MAIGALAGRTALVTGSGRGLGRAMALGLVGAGASVAIVDIDEDAVAEVVSAALAIGGQRSVIGISADLGDADECARVIEATRAEFGHVNILVNNAGVGPEVVRPDFWRNPIKLWEVPIEAWHRAFSINSDAPFYLIRQAVPAMIADGWGRVINVTTSLDTMIRGGYSPYGGSKAANEAHLSMLAQDLSSTGVTANVIVPGGPANTRLIPLESPVKREDLVRPEEMVPPLLWLASREADEVTGRRFTAMQWDNNLPPAKAAALAGAPVAWPQVIAPPRRTGGMI